MNEEISSVRRLNKIDSIFWNPWLDYQFLIYTLFCVWIIVDCEELEDEEEEEGEEIVVFIGYILLLLFNDDDDDDVV